MEPCSAHGTFLLPGSLQDADLQSALGGKHSQEVPGQRHGDAGSHPGRHGGPSAGSGKVRSHQGLQVQHLRDLVDPAVYLALNHRAQQDDQAMHLSKDYQPLPHGISLATLHPASKGEALQYAPTRDPTCLASIDTN